MTTDKVSFNAGDSAGETQRHATMAQQIDSSMVDSLDGIAFATATSSRSNKSVHELAALLEEVAGRVSGAGRPFHFIAIDNDELNSPAVVTLTTTDNGKVLYSTLIIEALSVPLDAELVQYGPHQIPRRRYCSHYHTVDMQNIVHARVAEYCAVKGIQGELIRVTFSVLPKSVEITDADSIAPFFDQQRFAAHASLKLLNGNATSTLKVGMLKAENREVVSNNQFRPNSTMQTVLGELIHYDAVSTMIVRTRAAQGEAQSLHNTRAPFHMASAHWFMDFYYQQPNINNPVNTAMGPIAFAHAPMAVLTHVTALGQGRKTVDNLLTQLFAIAGTAGALSENRWFPIFTRGDDKNGKTGLGNLGLEHEPRIAAINQFQPRRLNVSKAQTVPKNSIGAIDVLQTFIQPKSMVIAQDVLQGGALSWLQSGLAAATPGSDWERIIVRELDSFFDGAFSELRNQAAAMGRQVPLHAFPPIEVHVGKWTDDTNTVRSLSAIDYLTFLGLCEGDVAEMKAFTTALTPGMCTPETMKWREDAILKRVPNATFTGVATRVFYNPEFINMINKAFEISQLRILMEGVHDITGFSGRGSMFSGQYVGDISTSGAYGYSQHQTTTGQIGNYFLNAANGARAF